LRQHIRETILSGFFLTLALVLPFFTAGNQQLGNMFLPMHIPVILCGFVCGFKWGAICGAAAPLLRSMLFGTPVLFPIACSMAVELAAYGALCGLIYKKLPRRIYSAYICLGISLLIGRLLSGIASAVFYQISGIPYGLATFITAAFVTALPGIALQFIIIPPLTIILEKYITKSR